MIPMVPAICGTEPCCRIANRRIAIADTARFSRSLELALVHRFIDMGTYLLTSTGIGYIAFGDAKKIEATAVARFLGRKRGNNAFGAVEVFAASRSSTCSNSGAVSDRRQFHGDCSVAPDDTANRVQMRGQSAPDGSRSRVERSAARTSNAEHSTGRRGLGGASCMQQAQRFRICRGVVDS